MELPRSMITPRIFEGQDVDVLSPFPASLLPQAVQWLHCHPTLTLTDQSPSTPEGLLELLKEQLQTQETFAIVDKNNLSGQKQTDLPVVGIVTVQALPPWNAYVHIASNRKAWGDKLARPGLVEQACKLLIDSMFQENPELLRLSALPLAKNAAAKGLCRRLGFIQEGLFREAVLIKQVPQDLAHFGLLRSTWKVQGDF